MRLSKLLKVTKEALTTAKEIRVHLIALGLLALFWTSILVPVASAVATAEIEQRQTQAWEQAAQRADAHTQPVDTAQANKPMKQDYAGPLDVTGNEAEIKTPNDLLGAPTALGEPLPGVKDDQPIKTGEVVEKRTAKSQVVRNADGTLTEKQYMQNIHYQKDGQWAKIDSTLVEDQNAGDSNNWIGQAYGKMQSWFSSTTHFQVKENDWKARFSPSDSSNGMVRVQKDNDQISFTPLNAKAVAPVITTDEKGQQTVHYYDLWPGVNVEYIVYGSQLKENIILKDKNAASSISFRVGGATLSPSQRGGFDINGAFDNKFSIAPISVVLNNSGVEADTSAYGQAYQNGELTVFVNEEYLQNLPSDAFPVTIDPGVDTYNGSNTSSDYRNYRDDNASCNKPGCGYLLVGGFTNGDEYHDWQSIFYAPYSRFQNTDYRLLNAKMHFAMPSSGWHGTTSTQTIYAYRASCFTSYNSCADTYYGSANIGTSDDLDLTQLYKDRIALNDYASWVLFDGGNAIENYKEFDANNSYMSFTWSDAPQTPPITVPGAFGQVFTDPQVPFKLQKVQNLNNATPIQYEIRVSTSPNGVGTIMNSGLLNAPQWTMPDGILQDGSTYYVSARSYDSTGAGYSGWSTSIDFRIDARLGKDKTQTYDTLGPVDVDLATGNVATSASSHTSSALGGSLGVSLDYNSPQRSRIGLVGQYWSNTAMAGSPVMERVDQSLDFDWGSASPSTTMPSADNFSVKWTGYFTVPVSGSYYFGGNNDDSFSVKVNNTTVHSSSGCWPPTPCYGSAVSLTAGQLVPIEAIFTEQGGNAIAKLWVKGAVSESVMPSSWLRTAPRTTTQAHGLTGRYYHDNGSHSFTNAPLFMERNDPWVNMFWDTAAPVSSGPTDNFLVRWTGFFTAPVAGNYEFGAYSDDGVRVTVGTNNNQVINQWQNQSAADRWGGNYTLSAGQSIPITVEYYEHTGGATMALKVRGAVAEQVVPTSWLSPKAQILPDGWNLGIDPDGNLSYDHAKINQASVVLTDSTGSTHEYTFKDGGYKPPINEDGQLVRNADGSFTLTDVDGRTYVFGADGTLTNVTSPVDDRKPAALQYSYQSVNGRPARLAQITDGVTSSRWAKAWYIGDSGCGTIPGGFDIAPGDYLCALQTNDGRSTYFYYKNGRLSRIAEPSNEFTDYEYDSSGRIITVRDSLANDAIAAGVRANDATATTQLTYDELGRVSTVKQPAATTGATRTEHTIEYLSGTPGYQDGNPATGYYGATLQHITGMTEPNGFARRVEYDNILRTTKDTDIANLSTTQEWNISKDLLYSTTDAAGLKTTTIFDDEDRPIDSYGPAPSSYYGTDRRPTSAYVNTVPRTEAHYDEGVNGPAVSWYNTRINSSTSEPVLYGAPKLHTTGVVPSSPNWMGHNFSTYPAPITVDSGNDNIAWSATGKITFPQTGNYTFKYWHDDGARLYVDDKSLFADADWKRVGETQILSQATFSATAGKVYRFRMDFVNRNAQFQSESWLAGPGITDISGNGLGTNQWGTYIRADYSLTTSTKTYDATLGDSTTTTNYGSNPELGLAQNTTVNPAGINLTTSTTYEQQGATGSFLRQTAKYLPGANTAVASTATQYSYYTATETKDNPCTTGTTEAYNQAGFIKLKTEPDPDGTGSQTARTTETIYDDSGAVVATRYNADSWTCTTYDARGRVATTAIPSYNGRPARTIQNGYAVNGDPLIKTSGDSQGSIIVWSDLLGRTTKYQDVYNDQTTSTYNTKGDLVERTGPLGTENFTYDDYGRLVDQKLDDVTYAHIMYDNFGRIDTVTYPAAGQQKNVLTRDNLGRLNNLTYTLGNGTSTVADAVTFSQSGQIVSGAENGIAKSYTYDGSDRLTSATLGSNTFTYGFGAQDTSCGTAINMNANAGKNSNRTSQTINGVSTTYCYDYADRLISSSNPLYSNPAYDSHGNMTKLGVATSTAPETKFLYDSSDRNYGIEQTTTDGNGYANYYARDAQGRLVYRERNTITNWNWNFQADYYYSYTGGGDTPDYVRNGDWDIVEKYLQLPGGVLLTIRPQSTGNPQKTYSLSNIHSDTMATTNASGSLISTYLTGPFGETIAGQTTPNNTTLQSTFGYVGQHEKLTETQFALNPTQMGARVYLASLGRFIQVDSVEGGTENNYVYPADPVNEFDLTGEFSFKSFAKKVANAASWVAIVPGPVGMVASGVSAAAYAASGDYKQAAVMAAGIAASAVGAGAAVKAVQVARKGYALKNVAKANRVFNSKAFGVSSRNFGNKRFGTNGSGRLNNYGKIKIGWSHQGTNNIGHAVFRIGFKALGKNRHINLLKGPRLW